MQVLKQAWNKIYLKKQQGTNCDALGKPMQLLHHISMRKIKNLNRENLQKLIDVSAGRYNTKTANGQKKSYCTINSQYANELYIA